MVTLNVKSMPKLDAEVKRDQCPSCYQDLPRLYRSTTHM